MVLASMLQGGAAAVQTYYSSFLVFIILFQLNLVLLFSKVSQESNDFSHSVAMLLLNPC